MGNLNGLSTINIELTSRCNKSGAGCWMCGRRKIEKDYPELARWGDMDYALLETISHQIPKGIVVQFHNNGEPLLYPELGKALRLFVRQIRTFDTNGKLLLARFGEIVGNLETITISTFEGDGEADEQYEILKTFLAEKGKSKPNVIVRCLGNVAVEKYKDLGVIIATRVFHSPMGSFYYQRAPTVPEIGICLDALSHLAIDRYGMVSMCVRFDPHREGVIGDIKHSSLEDIWNGAARQLAIKNHVEGKRYKVPLCQKCQYWGVPVAN